MDLENNKIHIVEARSVRFKDNDKEKGIEYYTKVPKNGEARFIMMSDLCRECVLYMMEQTRLKCKDNPVTCSIQHLLMVRDVQMLLWKCALRNYVTSLILTEMCISLKAVR